LNSAGNIFQCSNEPWATRIIAVLGSSSGAENSSIFSLVYILETGFSLETVRGMCFGRALFIRNGVGRNVICEVVGDILNLDRKSTAFFIPSPKNYVMANWFHVDERL
jgi:hypothetical protein